MEDALGSPVKVGRVHVRHNHLGIIGVSGQRALLPVGLVPSQESAFVPFLGDAKVCHHIYWVHVIHLKNIFQVVRHRQTRAVQVMAVHNGLNGIVGRRAAPLAVKVFRDRFVLVLEVVSVMVRRKTVRPVMWVRVPNGCLGHHGASAHPAVVRDKRPELELAHMAHCALGRRCNPSHVTVVPAPFGKTGILGVLVVPLVVKVSRTVLGTVQ